MKLILLRCQWRSNGSVGLETNHSAKLPPLCYDLGLFYVLQKLDDTAPLNQTIFSTETNLNHGRYLTIENRYLIIKMLILYFPLMFETIKVDFCVYMYLKLSNLMEICLYGDYFTLK